MGCCAPATCRSRGRRRCVVLAWPLLLPLAQRSARVDVTSARTRRVGARGEPLRAAFRRRTRPRLAARPGGALRLRAVWVAVLALLRRVHLADFELALLDHGNPPHARSLPRVVAGCVPDGNRGAGTATGRRQSAAGGPPSAAGAKGPMDGASALGRQKTGG